MYTTRPRLLTVHSYETAASRMTSHFPLITGEQQTGGDNPAAVPVQNVIPAIGRAASVYRFPPRAGFDAHSTGARVGWVVGQVFIEPIGANTDFCRA